MKLAASRSMPALAPEAILEEKEVEAASPGIVA